MPLLVLIPTLISVSNSVMVFFLHIRVIGAIRVQKGFRHFRHFRCLGSNIFLSAPPFGNYFAWMSIFGIRPSFCL